MQLLVLATVEKGFSMYVSITRCITDLCLPSGWKATVFGTISWELYGSMVSCPSPIPSTQKG